MKKRIISLFLLLCIALPVLSACGAGGSSGVVGKWSVVLNVKDLITEGGDENSALGYIDADNLNLYFIWEFGSNGKSVIYPDTAKMKEFVGEWKKVFTDALTKYMEENLGSTFVDYLQSMGSSIDKLFEENENFSSDKWANTVGDALKGKFDFDYTVEGDRIIFGDEKKSAIKYRFEGNDKMIIEADGELDKSEVVLNKLFPMTLERK